MELPKIKICCVCDRLTQHYHVMKSKKIICVECANQIPCSKVDSQNMEPDHETYN